MTNHTPTDILNFIKELLKEDTNLVSVTMNLQNAPLHLQAESTAILVAHNSITIESKDIDKADCFLTVHDSLKDYLKDKSQSFNLILGSGNTLLVKGVTVSALCSRWTEKLYAEHPATIGRL